MVVVNLRVNVSIHLKDVLPAIIVIINKRASPCDIAVVDSNTGSERNVRESPIAIVVVQVAGVVSEVGFENVEPAVAVVVGDSDTHPGLLMAAIAVGATSHYSDISESAVMIVLEENAWLRVYSNINIRPPIVIEVIRDRRNGVPRARFQNARLLRNIGKSAVSIVAIENVRVAGKA